MDVLAELAERSYCSSANTMDENGAACAPSLYGMYGSDRSILSCNAQEIDTVETTSEIGLNFI